MFASPSLRKLVDDYATDSAAAAKEEMLNRKQVMGRPPPSDMELQPVTPAAHATPAPQSNTGAVSSAPGPAYNVT